MQCVRASWQGSEEKVYSTLPLSQVFWENSIDTEIMSTKFVQQGLVKGITRLEVGIPLLILFVGTLSFRFTNLDLVLIRPFYVPGEGWVSKDVGFWQALYDCGPVPAITISVALLGVFIASFWFHRLKPHRKVALFFVLVMALGPGLIVNAIFKDNWGRARPRSIQGLGGTDTFHRIWEKGVAGDGKSFPSGHASMGFFLMMPFFVLRQNARRWAYAFLTFGITYGALMGLGRMIQGGHFASDVLWAWGFVYFVGLGTWHALGRPQLSIQSTFKLRQMRANISVSTSIRQISIRFCHSINKQIKQWRNFQQARKTAGICSPSSAIRAFSLLLVLYVLEFTIIVGCLLILGMAVYWGLQRTIRRCRVWWREICKT
jgi:membrane-associated PAP2 superfamily phosphatase